jgi:hypothetical protein
VHAGERERERERENKNDDNNNNKCFFINGNVNAISRRAGRLVRAGECARATRIHNVYVRRVCGKSSWPTGSLNELYRRRQRLDHSCRVRVNERIAVVQIISNNNSSSLCSVCTLGFFFFYHNYFLNNFEHRVTAVSLVG